MSLKGDGSCAGSTPYGLASEMVKVVPKFGYFLYSLAYLPIFWLLLYKWRSVIKMDIGFVDLYLSQMQIMYYTRALLLRRNYLMR